MGNQAKSNSGDTPAPEREITKSTTEPAQKSATGYVVARGRSVRVGGKTLGPGSPIAKTDHLVESGFIVPVASESPAGAGVRVGGLQIRGGTKPGATVA